MTAPAQLPLDLQHRPAHGREDFLIAPPNEDAVSWIDRWPEWPAPALVLHGPAGSGKTHLAAVWREKTDATLMDMERWLAGSVEEGKVFLFENADVWCGDKDAEEALFHLYNRLKEEGGSLLLTARTPPGRMNFIIPDLASRLRAAPAVAIGAPDDTLLTAVLVKLFSDRQLSVGPDVVQYLLPRMERSFAAVRDMVERVDRLALAEKRGVSVPLVRRVLLEQ